MKIVFGILVILFGAGVGLYVGVWIFFIGGIVTIIDAIKETPVSGLGILWGLIKIGVATFAGWLSFFISIKLGFSILKK